MARGNLQRAGLPLDIVHFNVCDAVDARPLWPQAGVLISNPPYNERVSIDTATWREFGATLRNHFGGWRALLLTSERRLPGQVGLRERRKTPLFNGQIECRLFEFEMRRRDAAGPVQHTA
jgi:putative N6-adenine-specific DNA methylase